VSLSWLSLTLGLGLALGVGGMEGWDLPLVPEAVEAAVALKRNHQVDGKFIPRIAWIAVKNASDPHAAHMQGPDGFIKRNANWQINFCGNEEKDAFMHKHFEGSAILWAYDILNPAIGVSRAEIWRLAVLYLHGGMYMDDDADIASPLDDVVLPTDKFVCGKEPYAFDDRCYTPDFPLSNHSITQRFPLYDHSKPLFEGRFFFNWALFSMPGSPLLARIMTHIVSLLRGEYAGDSKIKLSPLDHRGKLLMCASTFPITHAAWEVTLEGMYADKGSGSSSSIGSGELGLRVGGVYFSEYGARMKAWDNDWRPDRWVKQMHKQRLPYLRLYAPPDPAHYEGRAVQGKGQKEIYVVRGGSRRAFPDFETFLTLFRLEDVQMVGMEVLDVIPLGLPLPPQKR